MPGNQHPSVHTPIVPDTPSQAPSGPAGLMCRVLGSFGASAPSNRGSFWAHVNPCNHVGAKSNHERKSPFALLQRRCPVFLEGQRGASGNDTPSSAVDDEQPFLFVCSSTGLQPSFHFCSLPYLLSQKSHVLFAKRRPSRAVIFIKPANVYSPVLAEVFRSPGNRGWVTWQD